MKYKLESDHPVTKMGLLVNHARIQARTEADALRAAWAEALDRLKEVCEK